MQRSLSSRRCTELWSLDEDALREAQASHDALAAQALVQDVLLSSMARTTESQGVSA